MEFGLEDLKVYMFCIAQAKSVIQDCNSNLDENCTTYSSTVKNYRISFFVCYINDN